MHTPAAQQSTEQNASCTVTRGEQRTTMRHWIDLLSADPVTRGATASAILFVLLSLLLWRYHDLPYYWDALGYVFSHSQQIYDTNLFPILTDWDVGHPTLFFFCVGFLMKLFGVGPLAGHLATWAFTAVLLVAMYGNGRVAGLPRLLAASLAAAFFTFPLLFASALQMSLDLPLAALMMAALWFWARQRWLGYFVAGSLACLVKLYGFALVPALVLALLLSGSWRREGGMRSLFLQTARTLSPLLTFAAFLVIRYLVRGPGMTINWESGNKPVPIWEWEKFTDYLPFAFEQIYTASMLDRVLYATAILAVVAVVVEFLRRARPLPRPDDAQTRLLAACFAITLTLSLMFFQSLSLCARYNLPTAGALFLACGLLSWRLLPRFVPHLLLHALLAGVFITCWHPSNADRLPAPLNHLLRRVPEPLGFRLENDLRFLDVIRVTSWAAEKIDENAKKDRRPAALSTNWPFHIALADPRFGYYRRGFTTHAANAWAQVEGSRHPYVLIIRPVSEFYDKPPGAKSEWPARRWKSRTVGEVTAEIWLIRRDRDAAR